MNNNTILIIHQEIPGDASDDEKDVLDQAELIESALSALGYHAERIAAGLDLEILKMKIARINPLLVFNLVETLDGKGSLIHLVPALLEAMGIPFTGSSSAALMLSSNKLLSKQLLAAAALPVPDWQPIDPENPIHISFPCIVKSIWEHASFGLNDSSVIFSPAAGRKVTADIEPGGFFAERFIDGREFNIAVLEKNGRPVVLPIAEISFAAFPPGKTRIVGYAAKWDSSSFEYSNTPRVFVDERIENGLCSRLRELTVRCWEVFGLRGYARVDFRIDAEGNPWVLEVNSNPCLSEDAGFMAAAAMAGLSPKAVIEYVISAVGRVAYSGPPARMVQHGM